MLSFYLNLIFHFFTNAPLICDETNLFDPLGGLLKEGFRLAHCRFHSPTAKFYPVKLVSVLKILLSYAYKFAQNFSFSMVPVSLPFKWYYFLRFSPENHLIYFPLVSKHCQHHSEIVLKALDTIGNCSK